MSRIELFNDEKLLLTIFDYLITKPSSKLNIDLLPHISKDSFDKICDSAINQRSI